MVIEKLYMIPCILALVLIMPLLFIAVDYFSGIRKAKKRGERITSKGWRRTVDKIARYYSMLLALVFIDALIMTTCYYADSVLSHEYPIFPFISMLGAVFVAIIETKSICEPADEKEKRDFVQIEQLIKVLTEKRASASDIAQEVIKSIYNDESNTKNQESN